MFRTPKYCDRYEYTTIRLSTPLEVNPGNATNQRKDGYTFLINDRSSYFDWYNAYLNVSFKIEKHADGSNYDNANAVAMINDAASLISDMQVKQNGKMIYDGTNLFRLTNVINLLEMSKDYAETSGTNEFFYLDTTTNTEIRDDHPPQNEGFLRRTKLKRWVNNAIIPLNKFTFFKALEQNMLPPSQIQLEFGLTTDDNLIYRANGIDAGRVVVSKFQLVIPKMILNPDGLNYAIQNFTNTSWTYHREMLIDSPSLTQASSTWSITAGVQNPMHIFIYFQRTNVFSNQEQNPHIFNTYQINAANNLCYLRTMRLEVGNGLFYPEMEYSYDDITRIFRDVINYTHKQNDKNTGSLLTRANYETLFGIVHFDLSYRSESLIGSDPKQLVLHYSLSRDATDNYKIHAIILYNKEVKVNTIANETIIE